MMHEQPIAPIHTSCKNCVFAKYDGITQTDCLIGMLTKLKECNGAEILEVYDEDKEFYVINNKKCFGCKEPGYFTNRKLENTTIEEKIEYVKNLLVVKYVLMIDCSTLSPERSEDILTKLNQDDNAIKPVLVNFFVGASSENGFNEYFQAFRKSGLNCKWKIINVQDEEEPFITSVHRAISTDREGLFICTVSGNDNMLHEIITEANTIAYEKMERFIIISNKEGTVNFYNKLVYKNSIALGIDIYTTTNGRIEL